MNQKTVSPDDTRIFGGHENRMKYIPGGVYICEIDDQFTLISMSENFLLMLGYSDEEIRERFHNHLLEMIYADDRRRVAAEIKKQLSLTNLLQIEYRIQAKNGEILWVLDRGNQSCEEGRTICYCMILDITKQRDEREQLRLALERHEIIMNQARDIIFEWDIEKDTLVCSSNWYKKFGYAPLSEHVSTDMFKSQNIYSEDMRFFKEIMESTAAGVPYSETEFRIRNATGDNIYCRIRATTQYDSKGTPIKAVGVIIDISKEKYQWQVLIDQTQRDSLTGLLHKNAAKQTVNLYLQQTDSAQGAMLLVDLDNFKQVNDRYGHLCGDALLTNTARALLRVFRAGDIISRVGGDEFVIFLPQITKRHIGERIETLKKALAEIQVSEIKGIVSCSIGISFCPDHGRDFNSLYKCADLALYYVKNNRKGKSSIYLSDMETDGFGREVTKSAERAVIDSDFYTEKESLGLSVFKILYDTEDFEADVNRVLKKIGLTYKVSKICIFEDSDDGLSSNTFEWCNQGVSSQIDAWKNLPYGNNFGNYYDNFDENGVFYCCNIHRLKPGLYDWMKAQGICSFLQYAIVDHGKYKGYIGFNDCHENHIWTREQTEVFLSVSRVLGIFLLKYRLEEKLKL